MGEVDNLFRLKVGMVDIFLIRFVKAIAENGSILWLEIVFGKILILKNWRAEIRRGKVCCDFYI